MSSKANTTQIIRQKTSVTLTEKIPEGFRPSVATGIVGNAPHNGVTLGWAVYGAGSIDFWSGGTADLPINSIVVCSCIWTTNDSFPKT